MQALLDVAERDQQGRFKTSPDSLHPKTIGLRLQRAYYPNFLEVAREEGLRPTELARKIIQDWMESRIQSPKDDA